MQQGEELFLALQLRLKYLSVDGWREWGAGLADAAVLLLGEQRGRSWCVCVRVCWKVDGDTDPAAACLCEAAARTTMRW